MQLSEVSIRNYTGSVSNPEKVAPLHPSKFPCQTSPGRHQIQNAEGPVLDPCAKQRRDPKWTLLGLRSEKIEIEL